MQKNSVESVEPQIKGRVIVVDDEEVILRVWKRALERKGHEVYLFDNAPEALDFLKDNSTDVALLDHMMPEMTGLELLSILKKQSPEIEVVMMTGYASIETALAAMKQGAYDYLQKPFEQIEVAVRVVEKAMERKQLVDQNKQLSERLDVVESFQGMVGASPKMQHIFQMVEQVAGFDASVFIHGETGTGKEQLARAIHYKSARADKPFVPVVCGSIPASLIESELFGYVKGAFTGATRDKMGLIQSAHGGTLFLDEVGDIPLDMQVKLLRVIQEGEIIRLGDSRPIQVDLRILAATHRDLKKEIAEGRFREDLYYRINLIELELPPLRERTGDIPLLAHHFLRQSAQKFNKSIESIDAELLSTLQRYNWPGNVRQLQHIMARAVIMETGPTLSNQSLTEEIKQSGPGEESNGNGGDSAYLHMPFREAKQNVTDRFEKRYLRGVLARAQNNVSQAARLADMDRANFRRLLKKHDLR